MSAVAEGGGLNLEADMGERLGRPWGGVKTLSLVWDGEGDHRLSPLSTKPSQGLIDVQDAMMGGESVMNLVRGSPPFEFFYSRFHSRFAPGFTPDSRSNLIALRRTRSRRIAHHFNVNITHCLTPSHSIPIPTDRPFKAKSI